MWVFYAIRLELSTKVTYMLGHSRITGTQRGASVINITVWPSPNQQQQPGEYHFNSCVINITSRNQFDDIVRSTQEWTEQMTDIFGMDEDDDDEDEGFDLDLDLDFNDDDDNNGGGGNDDNKGNTCYEAGSSSQPNTVLGGDAGPCQSIDTPTGASCGGQ